MCALPIFTSDDAFHLLTLPRRVIVSGVGYIAVELASIVRGLGVQVTQLYRGELFLRGFDAGVRTHLRDELCRHGIALQFNADIQRIAQRAHASLDATLRYGRVLHHDCLMFTPGRRPPRHDLGLDQTPEKRTNSSREDA